MKIQKPTKSRNIEFTPPNFDVQRDVRYAGMIVGDSRAEQGIVDLVTFGTHSMYFQQDVPHNAAGWSTPERGSWRYPPRNTEEIEVAE